MSTRSEEHAEPNFEKALEAATTAEECVRLYDALPATTDELDHIFACRFVQLVTEFREVKEFLETVELKKRAEDLVFLKGVDLSSTPEEWDALEALRDEFNIGGISNMILDKRIAFAKSTAELFEIIGNYKMSELNYYTQMLFIRRGAELIGITR